MNKYLATVAVGVLLTTAGAAIAQTTPTSNGAKINITVGEQKAPEAAPVVAAPAQPTAVEPASAPAPIVTVSPAPTQAPAQVTITTVPAESTAPAAPTMPVIEMPKADPAFFDHVIDAFNSKNIDALMEKYSKDGFVVVTDKGDVITDKEALKHHYVTYLSGDKKINASLHISKVMDIAPGVAVATGKVSMKMDGEAKTVDSAMTATIKYEDGAWGIVSKQTTMVEMAKPEEQPKSGGGLKMFLTLIVGAVVGFFASKYMAKKPGAAA